MVKQNSNYVNSLTQNIPIQNTLLYPMKPIIKTLFYSEQGTSETNYLNTLTASGKQIEAY